MLINTSPHVAALEAQAEALRVVNTLIANRHPDRSVQNSGWAVDKALLEQAAPFVWSADAIAAVLDASRSIPLDTPLTWNLNTRACWWWFETPLPVQTIRRAGFGVRALTFGWLKTERGQQFIDPPDRPDRHAERLAALKNLASAVEEARTFTDAAEAAIASTKTDTDCECPHCHETIFPAGTPITAISAAVDAHLAKHPTTIDATPKPEPKPLGMPCVAWLDNVIAGAFMQPSQTFEWEDGAATLGEMIDAQRLHYERVYGPRGPHHGTDTIGVDAYMAATEALARFLLAGLAWVQQSILVTSDASVERHARKRYARAIGSPQPLRVVHLRRTVYTHGAAADTPSEGEGRGLSVRFTVDGHWRNQPCGPRHGERRLTWISPFMKGPDDAPFKPKAVTTVYAVTR